MFKLLKGIKLTEDQEMYMVYNFKGLVLKGNANLE